MNITKVERADLTQLITIEITPEDYQKSVEKKLKEYQRKSQEPGFRPGKVPFGLISKKYGPSVRMDEINDLINDELNKFLSDETNHVIGQPIADLENQPQGDFMADDSFKFFFVIGTAPELSFDIKNSSLDFYNIKIDDTEVENALSYIRKQHGTQQTAEGPVQSTDIIKGLLTQLDENNNPLTDGITNEKGIISVQHITDETCRDLFVGTNIDDVITFNPDDVAGSNLTEKAHLLGIAKDKAGEIHSNFTIQISEITRLQEAELNEELFKKMYPNKEVSTIEEFKEIIKNEIITSQAPEMDKFFVRQVVDKLYDENHMDLPDEYLKRWLLQSNEEMSEEDIQNDYPKYAQSIRLQLIQNKIIKDFDIRISKEEIREQFKKNFLKMYGNIALNAETDEALNKLTDSLMSDEKQVHQVQDNIITEKIAVALKENATVTIHELTPEEYNELLKEANKKMENE